NFVATNDTSVSVGLHPTFDDQTTRDETVCNRENRARLGSANLVFAIANGFVAGCLVVEGRVQANAHARIIRRNEVVVESKVDTLRRVKDEVKEVRAGTECGIHLAKFNDYKEGDIIEIFEVHEVRPEL
ncbi:MAG: hypothetical protein AAGB46_17425, partial [Verrucomicrobiota bacterium]